MVYVEKKNSNNKYLPAYPSDELKCSINSLVTTGRYGTFKNREWQLQKDRCHADVISNNEHARAANNPPTLHPFAKFKLFSSLTNSFRLIVPRTRAHTPTVDVRTICLTYRQKFYRRSLYDAPIPTRVL